MTTPTLFEMINDNSLNSKYEGINFEQFKEKQENPSIKFLTYKDFTDKKTSIENIKDSLRKYLNDSFKEVEEEINRKKEKLEETKFWNWHNPIGKKYWKSDDLGKKCCSDILHVFSGGLAIYGLKDEQSLLLPLPLFVGSLWFKGTSEFLRRGCKSENKKDLAVLENSLSKHNNLKSNIERATIDIIFVKEAQESIEEIIKSNLRFVALDIKRLNNYLMKVYSKA